VVALEANREIPTPCGSAGAVPFVARLASFGDSVAIITADDVLTYRELADRVEAAVSDLGRRRRLMLLVSNNEIDALVFYLAALSARHPVLLVPDGNAAIVQSMVTTYDPDVVVSKSGPEWRVDERRDMSVHDLHRDLALLLSTSGSTGSPKVVRLSHDNLQANAESIAAYLDIRSTDRAATTLPMHYCYGLSVINSHLLRGAGLILTDLSVVDARFWDLFRDNRGTSFAGVPYTFDLLDRVGFAGMRLPHLRYLTQAGGRMAPERIHHYATLGQRRGWDLFVMYGQTEATARMAYLPPELAASHPQTIGIPIPGGSFSLEPAPGLDEPDSGELVYAGPNVMLGYAESPADLRRGQTIDVLHTGDLARRTPDGLYEVIGRRSRFVKVFGLRIDLQRLETVLCGRGRSVCCVDNDDELVVAVEGDSADLQRRAAEECGLPIRAVRVVTVRELPRLANRKPDYHAVRALAAQPDANPSTATAATTGPSTNHPVELRALYAELLDRSDVTDDSSFVSLGGDSLSYVEMSVRLEQVLGRLPADWHNTPIRQLRPATGARPRRRAVEISVVVRAVAIVLVVGSHAHLFTLVGTAHVLLAVAGFNFARFQLTSTAHVERIRHQLRSVARIAVPSVVWIAGAFLLTPDYSLANVFLLNGFLGPDQWTTEWHFWFVEILVYILLALTALLAIPWADRMERRFPFGFASALLSVGLLTRFGLVDFGVPHMKPALWLFALGWAAARTASTGQRAILTLLIVATVPEFFGDPQREAMMIAGLTLLVWVRSCRLPRTAGRAASVLASGSLFIYLTHWQIYPLFAEAPAVALTASIGVGILYWQGSTKATGGVRSAWDAISPGLATRSRFTKRLPHMRKTHDPFTPAR
jgi:acyl-CoA synthetase (AMP-forming)/AMP-acid ligase II